MSRRNSTIAGAFSVLLAAMIAFAGQAHAAPTWEMPGVTGSNLENAAQAIHSLDGANLRIIPSIVDGYSQEIHNLTNWMVCWQVPKAGVEVKENRRVYVGIARPNSVSGC